MLYEDGVQKRCENRGARVYKSVCKEDGAGEDKEDGAGEDSAPSSVRSPKRRSMWWWDDPLFPPHRGIA